MSDMIPGVSAEEFAELERQRDIERQWMEFLVSVDGDVGTAIYQIEMCYTLEFARAAAKLAVENHQKGISCYHRQMITEIIEKAEPGKIAEDHTIINKDDLKYLEDMNEILLKINKTLCDKLVIANMKVPLNSKEVDFTSGNG